MKLIVEAGGTKIAWFLSDDSEQIEFKTVGYNPLQNDSNYLRQILISGFPKIFDPKIVSSISYFGTGCASSEGKLRVSKALKHFFSVAENIDVYSDLEAVGVAFHKEQSGIVGILGTGASVALYTGNGIEMPIPSLGYLLGDEGSGAYLGKILLAKILRKELDDSIVKDFYETYSFEPEQIIPKVYGHKNPAQFLASFAQFLTKHIKNKEVQNIVDGSLNIYIEKHIEPIVMLYPKLSITIVGSVAFALQEMLLQKLMLITQNKLLVRQSPLEGLVKSM